MLLMVRFAVVPAVIAAWIVDHFVLDQVKFAVVSALIIELVPVVSINEIEVLLETEEIESLKKIIKKYNIVIIQ